MLRYYGGEKVAKGTYWNFSTGQRMTVAAGEVLPGDKETVFYRISPLGILVIGPLLGLVYAAFLPFIGIAMMVKLIGQKAFGGAFEALRAGASFGWRPKEAYLAGKKKKGRDGKKDSDAKTTKTD
ncbi:MAG: hypothetical protein AB1553_14405 [Nitrospirota bacterium]